MKLIYNGIELEPTMIEIDAEGMSKFAWYKCDRCQNRTHQKKVLPIRDETLCIECYNIVKYCLDKEK